MNIEKEQFEKKMNLILSCVEKFTKQKLSTYKNGGVIISYTDSKSPNQIFNLSIIKDGILNILAKTYDKMYIYEIRENNKRLRLSYISRARIDRYHTDFITMIRNLFHIFITYKYESIQDVEFLRGFYSTPEHYRGILKDSIKWITNLNRKIYNRVFFRYTCNNPKYKETGNMIIELIKKFSPPVLEKDIYVYRGFSNRTLKRGVINEPLSTSLELGSNTLYCELHKKIPKKVSIKKGTIVFPILHNSKFPNEIELLVQPFTFIDIKGRNEITFENALDMKMITESTYNSPIIKKSIMKNTIKSEKNGTFIRTKKSSKFFERAKTSYENISSSKNLRKIKTDPNEIREKNI